MIPEVKDRNVEFPNRYRLVKIETGEDVGVYDLVEETGEVYEEGTVVDAELLNKYKDYAERSEAVDIEFFKRLKAEEDGRVESEATIYERIEKEKTDREAAIQTEQERATQAENDLDDKVDTETAERTAEVSRLEGLISDEQTRAETAESGLQSNIETETNTRVSEISRVEGLISAQNTALTGEITRLDGELEAEVSARDGEISRVEKAISDLQSDVDADLQAQDVLLRAEIAKVDKKVDAETSQRSAEITRVDGRIDALENDVNDKYIELEGKIVTETARAKAVEGEINNLTTTARGSLVNAINEVNDEVDTNRANIGDLSTLATEEQETIVGAINEVHDELDEEVRRAATTHEDFESRIAAIESKVPTAATAENKLVDRDTMNSTLVSSAAFFRGSFDTKAALDDWQMLNPDTATNNDYAYVQDDETHNHEAWRYIYGKSGDVAGEWQPQFKVNNAPLNADQVKALNSGITVEKVAEIGTKVAQKTDASTLYGVDSLGAQVMIPQSNFATAAQGRIADAAAKNIGDLQTLTTVAKQTLVAAINEVAAGATSESGAVGAKLDAEIAAREKAEKALDEKISAVRGLFRFSDSAVNSTFAGESTELLKMDLIGDGTPRVGDNVIFPDDKTLVLYIGRITAVNGDRYTVGDIGYINNVWQPSGSPWVSGIIASYPEVYNYDGGTWLCLASDVRTAPAAGNEWYCISAKVTAETLGLSDVATTGSYNNLVDKPDVPRPVYYKLAGGVMTDTGGVNQTYTVAVTNLTPQTPTPIVGDTVVFNTSESVYIGTVTQAQSAEVLVVVKMEVKGGGGGEVTGGVTSVNGRDGAVVLSKTDVGLGNVDNVRQYSASNQPPYPVTSVNGKTGAVEIDIPQVPAWALNETKPSYTKEEVGLGNVPNVDTTDATNITKGTLAKERLSDDVIESLNKADAAAKQSDFTSLNERVDTVESKIPTQASATNQLADKSFVNSSVQTATANFRGNWDTWSDVPTETDSYPEDYAGSKTPTTNDYLVVKDASGYSRTNTGTWRFKYSGAWGTNGKGGWKPEYQVNETPLTSDQLAALNSGATSALVGQITTNKNDIAAIKTKNTEQDTAISGKYSKPTGGIPKTDLASAVQTSLGKADTALQSITASGSQGVTASASGNKVTVTGVKASSTAYGVVKVYVDSSGYLCFET